MVSDVQIQEKIHQLLEGNIDLDAFEDWHAQNSWNIHAWGDCRAQRLAYAIELKLAEHSSGHLTYEDLLRELAALANPYVTTAAVATGSNVAITQPVQWSMSTVDIRPVAQCA